jgi:hypothetical protein
METRRFTRRSLRLRDSETTIIGFRLPKDVAQAVKIESTKRELALNALFMEMWELYLNEKQKK